MFLSSVALMSLLYVDSYKYIYIYIYIYFPHCKCTVETATIVCRAKTPHNSFFFDFAPLQMRIGMPGKQESTFPHARRGKKFTFQSYDDFNSFIFVTGSNSFALFV